MEAMVFVLAAVTILFALISGKIQNSVLTPPMVFTTTGMVLALTLGEHISDEASHELLEVVTQCGKRPE